MVVFFMVMDDDYHQRFTNHLSLRHEQEDSQLQEELEAIDHKGAIMVVTE